MVVGIGRFGLVRSKWVKVLVVVWVVRMKREMEKEVGKGMGEDDGERVIRKDGVLMKMRGDCWYELGGDRSVRWMSMMNNERKRVVMMKSCGG